MQHDFELKNQPDTNGLQEETSTVSSIERVELILTVAKTKNFSSESLSKTP